MDMDFVGDFELEYGRMVDFSRIIAICRQKKTKQKKHTTKNHMYSAIHNTTITQYYIRK